MTPTAVARTIGRFPAVVRVASAQVARGSSDARKFGDADMGSTLMDSRRKTHASPHRPFCTQARRACAALLLCMSGACGGDGGSETQHGLGPAAGNANPFMAGPTSRMIGKCNPAFTKAPGISDADAALKRHDGRLMFINKWHDDAGVSKDVAGVLRCLPSDDTQIVSINRPNVNLDDARCSTRVYEYVGAYNHRILSIRPEALRKVCGASASIGAY